MLQISLGKRMSALRQKRASEPCRKTTRLWRLGAEMRTRKRGLGRLHRWHTARWKRNHRAAEIIQRICRMHVLACENINFKTQTGHSVCRSTNYLNLWRSLGETNPCFSLERADRLKSSL